MMQTENQIYARLSAVFLPNEHDYVDESFAKLVYLKEGPLNTRLTRVLGRFGWDFSLLGKHDVFTDKSGAISVTQAARLTIRFERPSFKGESAYYETHYDNVGGDKMLALGKTDAEKVMNTVKGATTDAFKRCCASLGIGLYLKGIGKGIADDASMQNALIQIGFIPDLTVAKNEFLRKTGLTRESSGDDIKKRIEWIKSCGFNDYDYMTMNNYMAESYIKNNA